jgi:hypothetical protein
MEYRKADYLPLLQGFSNVICSIRNRETLHPKIPESYLSTVQFGNSFYI